MERERLAYELANFCLAYGILGATHGAEEMKKGIEARFDDVAFVEELINHISVNTKYRKDIDTEKLIELLSALDYIRLQHEYGVAEKAKTR